MEKNKFRGYFYFAHRVGVFIGSRFSVTTHHIPMSGALSAHWAKHERENNARGDIHPL